jgi:hypothetical protein|tara:strand:+ start:61 stop:231 length:171 start_codon:yes stop_codon:yes gene_type:complete
MDLFLCDKVVVLIGVIMYILFLFFIACSSCGKSKETGADTAPAPEAKDTGSDTGSK